MAKVIELWHYQAMDKALKALTEFEENGSREGFKKWKNEYSEKIKKEKESVLNTLKGSNQ
jgi:hypothetical protein